HELHAFDVGAGTPGALIHVTAADKFGSGGNADLVPSAVITDANSHGVRAVAVVVRGAAQVEPGNVCAIAVDVVVDGVPPIVIMVSSRAVPTAIMRLERGVVPLDAGISVGVDDPLPREAASPQIGRFDPTEIWFDGGEG